MLFIFHQANNLAVLPLSALVVESLNSIGKANNIRRYYLLNLLLASIESPDIALKSTIVTAHNHDLIRTNRCHQ